MHDKVCSNGNDSFIHSLHFTHGQRFVFNIFLMLAANSLHQKTTICHAHNIFGKILDYIIDCETNTAYDIS